MTSVEIEMQINMKGLMSHGSSIFKNGSFCANGCSKSSPHLQGYTVALVVLLLCLFPAAPSLAYENKECLACHRNYGRAADKLPEAVSNLYVDEALWEKDAHFEVAGLTCSDCHTNAKPETHPADGLQKVNCAECHEEQAESYYKTAHWNGEVPEGKQKPDCADCHAPHAMVSRKNPASLLYKGNIKAICLSCHEEMEATFSLSSKFLLFRISAHRKSDLANPFDRTECINCHFTKAVGHGADPLTETHCGQCHVQGAGAEKVVFGPFHLGPSLAERPLITLVEVINILIILALIAALVVWLARGFAKPREHTPAQE
jgi:predicted CXXCH cytochrome family protein